jgi:imidazolonepropionase-like amidohydrolase
MNLLRALSLVIVSCATPPATGGGPYLAAATSVRAAAAPPATSAQSPAAKAPALGTKVRRYVTVGTPRVVLEHVEVIDGTGAPPEPDQNVTIVDGKIAAISAGTDEAPREGTTVLDLRGRSVMPGIVGMHDHLWYLARPKLAADGSWERPGQRLDMTFSAPRLYLANGVTTIRTTGSVNPYADLELKSDIEKGVVPGPHMDVSGPYLDGPDLAGPEDAARTVAFWADRGVTSFKAYQQITRAELKAAVDEAHRRGLKVTGHLCSVTYEEAVDAGIDDLEHGFMENTQLDPDKKPDTCPQGGGDYSLDHMSPDGDAARRLIALLVQRHVAVTSTLPLRATSVDNSPPLRPEALEAMSASARDAYFWDLKRPRPSPNHAPERLRREMDLERAFVAAGGLLIAGPDPVGLGGNLPGFGDQREIELLVEAGFSPLEAIRIATWNGAVFLGRQDRIGSIAVGKNADIVVVRGDPATRIADVEHVEIVFKDGAGYDTRKLLDSVKGTYGEY